MITLAGCVAAHTAGCRPVVPSSWEEGTTLGVNNAGARLPSLYGRGWGVGLS